MAHLNNQNSGTNRPVSKSIPVVPAPVFKPTVTNKAIYCFPPGTSEADKQHDIEQVNLWIESIKARRKK